MLIALSPARQVQQVQLALLEHKVFRVMSALPDQLALLDPLVIQAL